MQTTRQQLGWKVWHETADRKVRPLLKVGAEKPPNIITLQSKVSLTGHALPFTGIILSPRLCIRRDKLNSAL